MNVCLRQVNDYDEANEVSMLIAGTGGLGVVSLTKLMADCLGARFQCVHTEETRGIAQRRAPVTSIVRAGRAIRSARLPNGLVDVMLAVEVVEALRAVSHVGPGTRCVLADLMIPAAGAMSSSASRISVPGVVEMLEACGADVLVVPVAQWLRRERLPEMLSASAVFGAISHLFGYSLEQTEARLIRQVGNRMRLHNIEAVRIGYGAAQTGSLPRSVERISRSIDFELVGV